MVPGHVDKVTRQMVMERKWYSFKWVTHNSIICKDSGGGTFPFLKKDLMANSFYVGYAYKK